MQCIVIHEGGGIQLLTKESNNLEIMGSKDESFLMFLGLDSHVRSPELRPIEWNLRPAQRAVGSIVERWCGIERK